MDDGNYRLSWRQRIGFSSGDLAQNLIYQTVSIWLLFFYTNVFGLKPGAAAVMFLVVRIIDVIWDPVVGTVVDKANPRWGKYRSWLIMGGLPLAAFAMLCFWNGFSGSLLYAYITISLSRQAQATATTNMFPLPPSRCGGTTTVVPAMWCRITLISILKAAYLPASR